MNVISDEVALGQVQDCYVEAGVARLGEGKGYGYCYVDERIHCEENQDMNGWLVAKEVCCQVKILKCNGGRMGGSGP